MPKKDGFPTAHQLDVIAAVADHGSVSSAATQLCVSQPSVTAQVRSAEAVLGQRLFVRTPTGIVPTPAGRVVVSYARRQWTQRRGLLAALAQLAHGTSGVLIVGASSTLGEQWLPDRLPALRRRYPNIDVRVVPGNSRDTIARLENGHVDVATVSTRTRARALKFAQVGSDRIVTVAARGSRWARGELRPRTLADAAFIVREEGSATRELGLACLRRAGVIPNRLMPVSSDDAVARMTAADLGIGILPLHAAHRFVESRRLALVRVHGWRCRRKLYAVRRTDVRNPLVDAFWSVATKRVR